MARELGKYLLDFSKGLAQNGVKPQDLDSEFVSNAAYVGKHLFALNVPDDFKPEGTAAVISPSVIWELYAIKRFYGNGPLPEKVCYESAFSTGIRLSSYDNERLVLSALYLAYKGEHLDKAKREIAEQVLGELRTQQNVARARRPR